MQQPQQDPQVPGAREDESASVSRRDLLGRVGTVAALGAAGVALPSIGGVAESTAQATPLVGGGLGPEARRQAAYNGRINAAKKAWNVPIPAHPNNNAENEFPRKIANFTKGLPHNQFGEVDLPAYDALKNAINTWEPSAFELIPHGCADISRRMKFVNPQAGLAYDLEGTDSHQLAQPPAPRFESAWQAGEIVENYWMALLRDVPFTEYPTNPLVAQACADLSALSDFRGPKSGGQVTPDTLFRMDLPGWTKGPFLSQFFWLSQPFGAQLIDPRIRTVLPGVNYMTNVADWLEVQNGIKPLVGQQYDNVNRRYMRNGRDLGQWVHIDVLFQAYFQAALNMMAQPDPTDPWTGGGIGNIFNPGNPYVPLQKQDPFGTFGGPFIATILCEIATRALKAVWFQKWFVHRRLRPEEFAGRIHFKLANNRTYPIHGDALNSQALAKVQQQYGTSFLPQAFPEGCPIHPSYGAGHATVAGACVTMLKALFCEGFTIPNPVVPSPDGLSVVPYTGPDAGQLTVRGELNKLAANVALGRNIAGVHWRTDALESLLLGEAIAISVLREQKACYNEPFAGFIFSKFDGTQVQI
jgi:hypothetical protein